MKAGLTIYLLFTVDWLAGVAGCECPSTYPICYTSGWCQKPNGDTHFATTNCGGQFGSDCTSSYESSSYESFSYDPGSSGTADSPDGDDDSSGDDDSGMIGGLSAVAVLVMLAVLWCMCCRKTSDSDDESRGQTSQSSEARGQNDVGRKSYQPDGKAHRVGWDRSIHADGLTVANEVARQQELNPDNELYVITGAHGAENQAEHYGPDAPTFIPSAWMAEKRFYDADKHLEQHGVHVLNVANDEDADLAREALDDPDNNVIFAVCHGVDNKRF